MCNSAIFAIFPSVFVRRSWRQTREKPQNAFFLHFFAKKFAKPYFFIVPLHRDSKKPRDFILFRFKFGPVIQPLSRHSGATRASMTLLIDPAFYAGIVKPKY